MTVTRIWAKRALKPHRLEGYLASNASACEAKATDMVGLYLHPPQYAAVFCADEKPAIQMLDRKDPVLPLSPWRAERRGVEYVRHGILSFTPRSTPRRASCWQELTAPHLGRVRGIPDRHRDQPAQRQRNSRDRPWGLYLGVRSQTNAHALYPARQYASQTREVKVLRFVTSNYSRITRDSPLAPGRVSRLVVVHMHKTEPVWRGRPACSRPISGP